MIIDPKKIQGQSAFAIAGRKNFNSKDFAIEVAESYASASKEGKDHLMLIFGKENLIRIHQVCLDYKYN